MFIVILRSVLLTDSTDRYKSPDASPEGATLILECSGNDTAVAASLHAGAIGGRVVLVGMTDGRDVPIQVDQTQWRQIQILGSVDAPFFFPKTLAFVSQRLIDLTAIITHRMPLVRVVEAFEMGASHAESAKIMIDCA